MGCRLAIGAMLCTAVIASDGAAFNITPPVRLVDTDMYLDGGTLNFVLIGAQAETLRGGFDNSLSSQIERETCPPHCFVGGTYPTNPGVRLLPLWGPEERELVDLLMTVVRDMASPDEVQVLLRARGGADVPIKFYNGKGHFIAAVEGRRQTLEAIDHGLLASHQDTNHIFAGADTARVESLIMSRATNQFVVTFRDALGGPIRMTFPASLENAMGPSFLGGRNHESRYATGSHGDRRFMTYVAFALRDSSNTIVNRSDKEDLLRLLEVRRAKILELDRGC